MVIFKKKQTKKDHQRFGFQTPLALASFFFLLPNMLFAFQGLSTRYWADDYCFSGFIKKFGFIDGLVAFYTTTSNRFSAFIFSGLSEMFGSSAIRLLPMLVIVILGLLLYHAIHFVIKKNQITHSKRIAFLFSQIVLFFILYLSPAVDQTVYWRSGLTHYFLPIPFLLVLLMIIFFPNRKESISVFKSLFLFLLASFNAGLSESYAAFQMGLFLLVLIGIIVFSKLKSKKGWYINIFLVLIGTAAAMLIMIFAPGNSLRLNSLQQAPDLFSIISIAASSAFNFIKFSIRGLWLPFLTLFVLSISAVYYFIKDDKLQFSQKQLAFVFVLIALAIFGLIICICAPTAYGMMAYPEQRVLMLAQITLVFGIFSEGVVIGLLLQIYFQDSRVLSAISLLFFLSFCLYPLSTLQTRITEMSIYSNRAILWDSRDAVIRSQVEDGKTALVVSALDSFSDIAELSQDEHFWVNQCAANYYGLKSITAVER